MGVPIKRLLDDNGGANKKVIRRQRGLHRPLSKHHSHSTSSLDRILAEKEEEKLSNWAGYTYCKQLQINQSLSQPLIWSEMASTNFVARALSFKIRLLDIWEFRKYISNTQKLQLGKSRPFEAVHVEAQEGVVHCHTAQVHSKFSAKVLWTTQVGFPSGT